MPAQTVIKIRRDSSSNWTFSDPILADGEIGFESDTNRIKIGNGDDVWTLLKYASASLEISETEPTEPNEGNVWFNSTNGRAYIFYDLTWVDLNPGIAGPQGVSGVISSSEAPEDTSVLWVDVTEEPAAMVSVPAGGDTGQVLSKVDATDYEIQWIDAVSVISNGTISDDQLAIPSGRYRSVAAISTSSSVTEAQRGWLITSTASSPITITIDTIMFGGDRIDFIQEGTGQVTFAAGSGVTLNSKDSKFKTNGRYSAVTAVAIADNNIRLVGDLTA